MANVTAAAPRERATAAIRVGDVFQRSRNLFAAHWASYCAITALGYAPFSAFWAVVSANSEPDAASLDAIGEATDAINAAVYSIVFIWIAAAVLGMLLAPAVVNFAVVQEMRGGGFAVMRSLTATLRRAPAILGTLALLWLCALAGAMLFIIPGALLFCMCSVAIPACLAERLGPIKSLSRSALLTRGNRWRVFAILCVLVGSEAALDALTQSVSAMIFGDVGVAISRLFVDAAVGAFTAVSVSVLYSALRVAHEGGDVEHIAKVFD
jgi:hypothetical protein